MADNEQLNSRDLHPGVVINLFDKNGSEKDRGLYDFTLKFKPEPGKVYVMGHGTSGYISDDRQGVGNAKKLGALDVAKMILEAGGNQNMVVVLGACSTGKGQHSFARELSHLFPLVEAPTRDIGTGSAYDDKTFHSYSEVYTEHKEREFPWAMDKSDPGRLKEFHSEDYLFCNHSPDQCDTAESELPAYHANNRMHYQALQGAYTANSGKVDPIVHERDVGDEKPLVKPGDEYAISPRLNVPEQVAIGGRLGTYNEVMANAYMDAITLKKNAIKNDVIERFPQLGRMFEVRDVIISQLENSDNRVAIEKSIDGHIASNIKTGHLQDVIDYYESTLSNSATSAQM